MESDYLLTLAYTIYEDRLCDCGEDKLICRHPDNDGWYTAHVDICHKRAAIDRFTKADKEPQPGQLVYATYDRPEKKPLPPLRTPTLHEANDDKGDSD